MTVTELQDALDDFHGNLQVVLRSDVGDTIDDFEDYKLIDKVKDGEEVVCIVF